MRFCRNGFLPCIMAIAFAIVVFNGASYAQFSVSINGPSTASTPAPTGQFTVTAAVSGNTNSVTKIVFYRNDVPYKTFTGSSTSQTLTENLLGQDIYTYRARAYDSQGVWVDSSDVKLTVETPRVFKMGDPIPLSSPIPTTGPNRNHDHTPEVQAAVNYLGDHGGGTLYFPCTGGPGDDMQSIYNIKDTITIPSNVTLQGESSEEYGRCRIYWSDVFWSPGGGCPVLDPNTPASLLNKPMFKIAGGTSRVRFRDLFLWSRSSGHECFPRADWERIEVEKTVAIALYGNTGHIRDIIFENVSISNFKYGIKASTCTDPNGDSGDVECPETNYELSDIKMRGVKPQGNYRQLYINAKYAYDWDVQNFNLSGMMYNQGAVEIKNAGAPASYTGENKELKFLQLNCNGNSDRSPEYRPKFCLNVKKHGGLYFKQLHHEGVPNAIQVEPLPSGITNDDPIIFEHSVMTGEFKDASMKLYLIGNSLFAAPEVAQAGLDEGRLRFTGSGVNSTVVDCGDIHWDITDVNGGTPYWGDLQMLFTHSERNRNSFFADSLGYSHVKTHTPCPSGVSGLSNINEIGGEHFNTGVMPMETFLPYSKVFGTSPDCTSPSTCAVELQKLLDRFPNGTINMNGGTIYINGSVTVDRTITIPSGRQIVGGPGSEIVLSGSAQRLFQINVPVGSQSLPRTSGNIIRNLKLKTTQANTTATGLAIIGDTHADLPGGASDMHFSGLSIEGFDKGLEVARFNATPGTAHPMVDGLSWKNISFVNNKTAAAYIFSSNLSNWNIMDLSMESKDSNATGWHQITAGNSMQNVTCRGTLNPMNHCIKLDIAATHLTGLKKTQNVTNALTLGENFGVGFPAPYQSLQFVNSVIRNNDFRSAVSGMSRVNILGKTFITSMNNRYGYINVTTNSEGHLSRLTYCGDTYDGNIVYPGLAERHPNLYVGVPTPTRVECGTRPIPWDDAIRWGGEEKGPAAEDGYFSDDQPLVGNFFDDVREDFVIYRKGSESNPQGYFRIKQAGGIGTIITDWGTIGDKPLIGRFFPNARAQIVIWRPSTGDWWVRDPNAANYFMWHWGLPGDIPFIGNFINESGGSISGDADEIAIYRPSSQTIWIYNPRSGAYVYSARNADYGTDIQVGDFLGAGYDQAAQYKDGVWTILDARTHNTYTANLGQPGDVPVAGKYLSGACTQLGVWRSSTQEFIVKDPFPSCGTREQSMIWGSNNDFNFATTDCPGGICPDDIPLRINTANGSLDRPTAYRPTKGVFNRSVSSGQWWVHDPF